MGSEDLYDIYFKGEILDGFQEADVRTSLQALFNAPASKIDQMFCGKAVTIKKAVDKTTALKYQTALKKAGAKPLIKAKTQDLAQDQTPKSAKTPEPVQSTKKQSLAERLAALDEEFSQQAASKPLEPTTAKMSSTQTVAPNTQAATGMNLLPVGADMLTSDEREVVTPVDVDISDLSMAEVGARIGEENQTPEPPAPDTDYLSVAETGADINPEKPVEIPLPEFDLSNMSVAETGERLIEPSPEPLPPAMDLSDMTLAEAGSVLTEKRDEPQVKAPDVSHIQLAD